MQGNLPESHWMRIDTHVHSSRHSPCAEFMHLESLKQEDCSFLDGIVVTDHDRWWAGEEWHDLKERCPFIRWFQGIELTAACGNHFVVIGMDGPDRLSPQMESSLLLDQAEHAGAAVILAHPFRSRLPDPDTLSRVHAIEILSSSFDQTMQKRAQSLAEQYGKPQIACSDAHAAKMLGIGWTRFSEWPEDEMHLAQLIRGGLCEPVIGRDAPC